MDEGYIFLRNAIINRAILDLRAYKKRPQSKAREHFELHRFFHSKWCEELLCGMSGPAIYRQIMEEKEDGKRPAHRTSLR